MNTFFVNPCLSVSFGFDLGADINIYSGMQCHESAVDKIINCVCISKTHNNSLKSFHKGFITLVFKLVEASLVKK